MTTVFVFAQRCMVILVIFLCYFHVRAEKIVCKDYPFHPICRGVMSRKRAMIPMYASGCDGSKGNLDCMEEFEERHLLPYIPLSKSRLLIPLLAHDPPKYTAFTGRHRQRSNKMDEQRTPLIENFLSEMESSDSDY